MDLESPFWSHVAERRNRVNQIIPSVDIPEGVSGEWRVERFTLSERDVRLHNLHCSIKPGMRGREIEPGTYTRLMRRPRSSAPERVVMSDTESEKSDHRLPVRFAKGHVLINGLGIGMVLNACLLKPEVQKVTVVEISSDVISLVGPHYENRFGGRVEIIHEDALIFTPPRGVRFGAVWHDIWDAPCSDNLPAMKTLHRKYGRRADWQGSWARDLC